MRYRIKISNRVVEDPKGERTIHQTKSKYDKPIFLYEDRSPFKDMYGDWNFKTWRAKTQGGAGGMAFGPGHYTSQNPLVSKGYEKSLPYRREEKLPQGTKIFDFDNVSDEDLLSIISAYKKKYKIPKSAGKLFKLSGKDFRLNNLVKALSYVNFGDSNYYVWDLLIHGKGKPIVPDAEVHRRLNLIISEMGYDAIEYSANTNSDDFEKFQKIPKEEKDLLIDFVIRNKGLANLENSFDKFGLLEIANPDEVLDKYLEFAKLRGFDHSSDLKEMRDPLLSYLRKLFSDQDFLSNDEEYKGKPRKINRALRKNESAKNILILNRAILTKPELFRKVRFDSDQLSEEEKFEYESEKNTSSEKYYNELADQGADIKFNLLEVQNLLEHGVSPSFFDRFFDSGSIYPAEVILDNGDYSKLDFFSRLEWLEILYSYLGDKILDILISPEEKVQYESKISKITGKNKSASIQVYNHNRYAKK